MPVYGERARQSRRRRHCWEIAAVAARLHVRRALPNLCAPYRGRAGFLAALVLDIAVDGRLALSYRAINFKLQK